MLSLCSLYALRAFAADPPKEADPPPTVTAAPGKGITVTSADQRFQMQLRGRVQARATASIPPPDDAGDRPVTTGAQVSTLRLFWTGYALNPDNKYVIQLAVAGPDYRDGATSPVFDAFFDFTHNPNVSVRVGQIFVPFDRLRTVREFALQLTTRPQPVQELTLDRDVGFYLYSDHLGGDASPVAYRLGFFGGRGTNQVGFAEAGGLGVARLELRPLGEIDDDSEGDLARRAEPGLALGVGAAYNLNTTRQRSTTGLTYAGGTADYAHLAGDLVFKARGFAAEGEVVWRGAAQDEVTSTAEDGTALVEPTQSGWGVIGQGSYAFTPQFELVGRYSRLLAAAGTDPNFVEKAEQAGQEVAAGANVYLNGHRFKVQVDWQALFGEAGFARGQHTPRAQIDVMF